MYVKDPFESQLKVWKSQLFINGREKVETKKLKNSKAFIDYSQTVDGLGRFSSNKGNESGNGVWWYDSRYGS